MTRTGISPVRVFSAPKIKKMTHLAYPGRSGFASGRTINPR
jgi:hypothetical protein